MFALLGASCTYISTSKFEEKRKSKGELVIQDPDDDKPAKGSNVIDLMAALKKSLGDDSRTANDNKRGSAKRTAAKKAPARKAAAPAKKTAQRKRA